MGERVAVVGWAQSKHSQRYVEYLPAELVTETVQYALESNGIDLKKVDMVIGAGCDMIDGRSISNVFVTEAQGAHLKEESKVEEDGAYAAMYAAMRILADGGDLAMVVAYGKFSESGPDIYSGLIGEPFYHKPLGLNAVNTSALQARAYMERFGVTPEQTARVSVKNHRNALKNPHATIAGDYTVEDVLTSPMIADPLRRLDCSPSSDGACVLFLAGEKAAKKYTKKPVWIRGMGQSNDEYYPGHKDLSELASATDAAKRAYKMAGISDPAKEIDIAEVMEPFGFYELMLYESLGFCEKGGGGKFIDWGVSTPEGRLPVNLSGGAISANSPLTAGAVRIAEACAQLTGAAGDMQTSKPVKNAVAHATSGLCMQSNVVFVLSTDKG